MVFDLARKPVDITRIMIYSVTLILGFYSLWRIQKFWLIAGIHFVIGFGLGILSGSAASFLLIFPLEIPIFLYVVRHYAIKYNEKITPKEVSPLS